LHVAQASDEIIRHLDASLKGFHNEESVQLQTGSGGVTPNERQHSFESASSPTNPIVADAAT